MGALKNKYIKTKQKNKNGKNDEENFRSREEAERKKNGEKKTRRNSMKILRQHTLKTPFVSVFSLKFSMAKTKIGFQVIEMVMSSMSSLSLV